MWRVPPEESSRVSPGYLLETLGRGSGAAVGEAEGRWGQVRLSDAHSAHLWRGPSGDQG